MPPPPRSRCKDKLPETEDFAYLAGFWLGDGSVRGFHGHEDDCLRGVVEGCLDRLNCRKAHSLNEHRIWTIYPDTQFKATMTTLGFNWTSCENKNVPRLDWPLELKLQLVAGLLDTDGSVSKEGAMTFQVSLEMRSAWVVNWVRSVMNEAGIITTLYRRRNRITSILSFKRPTLHLLYELVPMRGMKRDRLGKYLGL